MCRIQSVDSTSLLLHLGQKTKRKKEGPEAIGCISPPVASRLPVTLEVASCITLPVASYRQSHQAIISVASGCQWHGDRQGGGGVNSRVGRRPPPSLLGSPPPPAVVHCRHIIHKNPPTVLLVSRNKTDKEKTR